MSYDDFVTFLHEALTPHDTVLYNIGVERANFIFRTWKDMTPEMRVEFGTYYAFAANVRNVPLPTDHEDMHTGYWTRVGDIRRNTNG